MIKIKSPVTWIGNKTSILHILYALFPIGCDRYVEPFGGSGAVLLGKPVPDKFEVFNDYNHNLVNLFRCMRDRPMEFIRELGFLSLNSRDDFAVLKKFFEKEEFTEDYLKAQLDLTEIMLPEVTAKEVRTLKDLGVDVYFEEQGIHSNQPGAEFYITIYGSIAQSESENISANVKWGKAQSAKEGKVNFRYQNFLGYRKGTDGKPEIVSEEAETIRLIYGLFLAGNSLNGIAHELEKRGILSPAGKEKWQFSTVRSILSNEKYKGDAIINKTYITDCISKKVRANNGERPKYYVENSHPAIIDSVTFSRVQEELARRSGKHKVKQVGTKTEQGKYSSKYALTELLICGECKTPYRRCTWTASGKKKIVWRCINRLDYGKKYCHDSPSIEESVLQKAIMEAIMKIAIQNTNVMNTLKLHLGMGLTGENEEDNILDIQVKIAEIDAEFKRMLDCVSAETMDAFDDEKATRLMNEKSELQQRLAHYDSLQQQRENTKSRLDDICTILDGLKNHPMKYDDQLVRQLLECVVVESKEKIKVIFSGGVEVEQEL